ncbi:MAG: YbjQ family protein [Candidatus Marinimicrobia bacterium]|nr:YbjQ family protein [Candidatus Neomarinimicrobiota bacterium]
MLLTTQDRFEDHEIAVSLGIVKGNTIRARHIGKDIMAAIRNFVGGEVIEYTKLMAESREQAQDRMVKAAEELGANGITGIRFTSAAVMNSAAEILVYGTAVKLK